MGKVSSIFALALTATLTSAGAATNNASEAHSPQPSRYAGADLSNYSSAISSQFTITKRITDPFCQPQDPNAKPVVSPISKKITQRATSTDPARKLSNIVSQIPITTVMPREKRFLVGSRSISEGENLTLNHQNKLIHTQVTEVTSARIIFTNTETGEQAVRTLSLLPAGMSSGQRQITPAGMLRKQANTPLEIGITPNFNKP